MWYQTKLLLRFAPSGDRPLSRRTGTTARLFTPIVGLMLFIGLGALVARGEVSRGDMFPSLTMVKPAGAEIPAIKGHVALVDFWASWCAPCKASFSALSRLHAEFAARGLMIVGVSVDEKPSAYETFIKKSAPPFLTLLDREQKLVQSVRVPAMPTSYLIGRDGRVRFVHQGFHGSSTESELRAQIQSLLAEKSAANQ